MIESNSNTQIKKIQKLKKNARFRRRELCFVVEGWKMTEEALSRHLVKALYLSIDVKDVYKERLGASVTEVQTEFLSTSLFGEIADTVHPQGVLAIVKMPVYEKKEILSGEYAAVLCLEDIQDPGNLGTMIRTAEGAGMSGVLLSKGCVDLFNPKVVRSTMGAMFRVPFFITEDLSTEVESMKMDGFSIYAAHLQGTCEYTEESYIGKVGILIGNEANGLSDRISKLANKKVRIPMEGQLESLNAAVSAALFMYEIHKRQK